MKTAKILTEFESRAAESLKSLLCRFSAIKLIELRHEPQTLDGIFPILARVRIYGHIHTLQCDANPNGDPGRLRVVIHQMLNYPASRAAGAIPVVIAPSLSPVAQSLCKENKIGFLDFEGNASLNVGDFFVAMRSLPRKAVMHVSVTQQELAAHAAAIDPILPDVLPKVAGKHTQLPLSA